MKQTSSASKKEVPITKVELQKPQTPTKKDHPKIEGGFSMLEQEISSINSSEAIRASFRSHHQ